MTKRYDFKSSSLRAIGYLTLAAAAYLFFYAVIFLISDAGLAWLGV